MPKDTFRTFQALATLMKSSALLTVAAFSALLSGLLILVSHPDLTWHDQQRLGLIETFSLASAVICADTAVKAANVNLIEIRLGRGLGGKSFITMIGEVSAVRFAVESAEHLEETKGMVARTVVIPAPHPDILQAIF